SRVNWMERTLHSPAVISTAMAGMIRLSGRDRAMTVVSTSTTSSGSTSGTSSPPRAAKASRVSRETVITMAVARESKQARRARLGLTESSSEDDGGDGLGDAGAGSRVGLAREGQEHVI